MVENVSLTNDNLKREYDHPVRRMVINNNTIIIPTITEVMEYTDRQKELTAEQLHTLGGDAIRLMYEDANNRRKDRDEWERSTLQGMIDRASNPGAVIESYLELAGKPDKIADFVIWFANYMTGLEGRIPEQMVMGADHKLQTQDRLGEMKGQELGVGVADQLGDWEESHALDNHVEHGMSRLERMGLEVHLYDPTQVDPSKRKHELSILFSANTDTLNSEIAALHITRKRPYADTVVEFLGTYTMLHIVKQSDAIVPISEIRPQYALDIMQWFVDHNGEVATPSADASLFGDAMDWLLRYYETEIHKENKSGVYVAPESTSYFVKVPKKKLYRLAA